MSTMLIQSETLENIADAIRDKAGIDYQLTPADMVTEINAIEVKTPVDTQFLTTAAFGLDKTWTAATGGNLYALVSSTYLPSYIYVNGQSVGTAHNNDRYYFGTVNKGDTIRLRNDGNSSGTRGFLFYIIC